MRHVLVVFGLAAILSLMAGCVDGTQKITLNPDGSGKCEVDVYIAIPPEAMAEMGQGLSANDKATMMVRQLVVSEPGDNELIDAWSDLSFDAGKDGRIHFKGTCYFKKLQAEGMPFKIGWTHDPAGGMTLSFKLPDNSPASRPAVEELTPEQIQAKITKARTEWGQQKQMVQNMVGALKLKATFILPGKVDEASVFDKVAGGVEIGIDGKKFIDACDKLVNDDAAMTETIKAGKTFDGQPSPEMISKMLTGKPGKISAHVTGEMKPVFDYKTESEAAKKAQPLMFKKLGLSDDSAPMPKLDAPLAPTTAP